MQLIALRKMTWSDNREPADPCRMPSPPSGTVCGIVVDGRNAVAKVRALNRMAVFTRHVRSGEWPGCEHRDLTQGMIWDIDSFEQWGIELGKLFKTARSFQPARRHPSLAMLTGAQ
jgi:Phosphoglucose isomerase